jgi:transposase-like protein
MTTTAALVKIGKQIQNRRDALERTMFLARQHAIEAVEDDGMTEVEVARALGVDRARTLRRWLGK